MKARLKITRPPSIYKALFTVSLSYGTHRQVAVRSGSTILKDYPLISPQILESLVARRNRHYSFPIKKMQAILTYNGPSDES